MDDSSIAATVGTPAESTYRTAGGITVRRTRRAVIVDEGWRSGGIAAEISARIMERVFWSLDAPVARVASAEVPIPYPKHLEEAALPQVPAIVAAALGVLR